MAGFLETHLAHIFGVLMGLSFVHHGLLWGKFSFMKWQIGKLESDVIDLIQKRDRLAFVIAVNTKQQTYILEKLAKFQEILDKEKNDGNEVQASNYNSPIQN